MTDPFLIQGPALISFSGGRSSAYMLWRIVQAHGGTLPDDVHVTFSNTGKEMPETLDFVKECGERWGVEVVWLEYAPGQAPKDRWRRVIYETASREGEPYDALLATRPMLPSVITRYCTIELKIRPQKFFAQSKGFKDWTVVIGLRADEPSRVARSKARDGKEGWTGAFPLYTAGIVKPDISAFWKGQNFDLALPNINNKTPLGNCDLCFLKSAATISAIMREMPERAQWWVDAEARAKQTSSSPLGAVFRKDRPNYAAMLKAVRDQQAFDFGDVDELNDCFCGDGG